jgi:hypothetical protein
MDFTRALMFPFDDQDWLKKLGLGVLIQFIPVVGAFALQGWSYELTKRVKNSDPVPLPDWSDFGGLLSRGFMVFLASLIYQLPTVVFACVAYIIPFIASAEASGDAADALAGFGTIALVCCGCLAVLYAMAAAVVFWGGYLRYVNNPEFGTFFQFGENFALVRNNIGDFGMVLLYVVVAGAIAGLASSITFGLAGLAYTPFMMYFTGHLLGQLAQKLGMGTSVSPAV